MTFLSSGGRGGGGGVYLKQELYHKASEMEETTAISIPVGLSRKPRAWHTDVGNALRARLE